MDRKILLHNWTQRNDTPGGVETRMEYLKGIFPNSIFSNTRKSNYMNSIDLVIRDAACNFVSDVPQITIFGNPYEHLAKHFNNNTYRGFSNMRLCAKGTIKVANSKFMKEDMKKIGLTPDYIIPNCVDIAFWRPLNKKKKLREKYNIPINKRVGIFVGDKIEVKNWSMMEKIIEKTKDIYWLIIEKKLNKTRLEMRELYNCSDFLISISPYEGCNNSIFEALSCDIPCIISDTGYFYNTLGFAGGHIIKYNDLDMILFGIENIIKLKFIPRQFIISKELDLDHYKEKWKEVLKNVN